MMDKLIHLLPAIVLITSSGSYLVMSSMDSYKRRKRNQRINDALAKNIFRDRRK